MNTREHGSKVKLLFLFACCFPLVAAEPALLSVSPASSGGEIQSFAVAVSDSMGASDIEYVTLVIHGSPDGQNECRIGFDHVHERIESRSDCSATLVSSNASGEELTFAINVIFHSNWVGEKEVWAAAGDFAGNESSYQLMATTPSLQRTPFRPHRATLRWVASTTPDVTYNLYRASKSGGPYTKLNSTAIARTSYTDLSVSSGQTYYYVATAVSQDNVESAYSNEAVAVVPVD